MTLRLCSLALLFALMAAAPGPTVYSAPAGARLARAPSPYSPFNVILPNGRIVAPAGKSAVVGMNALGVALSPNGRYAIVTNDDEREAVAVSRYSPMVHGGYSLTVVDTATMRVTDNFTAKNLKLFLGVAAVQDPANRAQTLVLASGGGNNLVYFLSLDSAGKLHDLGSPVQTPQGADAKYANDKHSFPGSITVAANRRVAYVVNNLSDSVSAIDLAKRTLLGTALVGYFPYAAAASGRRLYVTDPGLSMYGNLPAPVRYPEFGNVPPSPQYASALTAVQLGVDGNVGTAAAQLNLDPAPDGMQRVGGAHPSAIAISKNGRYAYVCMTNVDRVAVVDLLGTPHTVGGLDLSLFAGSPYGTQPNAIVRSADGKRVYVALAGMNAVAVLDARKPSSLHRLGLIPTGWYPTAVTLSPDGRYLYVANAKGFGQEPRFQGGPPYVQARNGHIFQAIQDSNVIWATLERIDLRSVRLASATIGALNYNRALHTAGANALVPPLRSLHKSTYIKHVVFILEENKTYDSMLGDLTDAQGRPYGKGDPSLVAFGASITPNLHMLARDFALATNLYADGDESDAGHQFAAGGIATAYSEKTLLVKSGRYPLVNKNEDPEDYPRAGYIFHNAARAGISYRDYGDLVRLSGYDEGGAPDPLADDPNFRGIDDQSAPTSGLGGLYSLDVRAPAVLGNHIDLNYPGWNLRIRDVRRANEYISDFRRQPMPDFTYIWLPSDHGGSGANIPPLPEEVADGDRALGAIVDFLSHQPEWDSTAIFITPDDAQSSRDHVNEHRTYAIVVSPYARRRYTGSMHLSTVSVLKTEEELLGLPALSLGDLLATDMADFFTASAADAAPYTAVPVAPQVASAEGRRIAQLLERTDQSGADADVERSAHIIDLSRQADKVAQRRTVLPAARYAAGQRALYAAALRALNDDAR